MEIYKPIFIVGVPRSGTTLLHDLMALHPDLAFFSQLDLKEMLSQQFMEFQYFRRRIYEIRRWPFSRDGFEVRITTSFEMPHEFGLFWNKWIPKSWANAKDIEEAQRNGLRKGVNAVLTRKKKKRFLSKDPSHSLRIELLNEVFPGAIFVNIIRDGMAVVCSMTKPGRIFNDPNSYFGLSLKKSNQMDYDLLERHARQWIEINDEIQSAKNNLEPEQYYEIKYENLVSNPKKTLDSIFKFSGLDNFNIFNHGFKRISDIGFIEDISENLTSSNYKVQEEFDKDQIKNLKDIMHESLIRFEYT